MDAYKLEMRHICKAFGSLAATDNIDLYVRKGTVHAIIGENGAGKSTLMSILSSVQRQDSGDILIDGRPASFKDPLDAVRHGIGMVYQEFMQFRGLTVLDNIIMGYEIKKGPFIDKKASRKRLEQICADSGFSLPLDTLVDDLPVALLQQVEIVKVLYKNADIIILDEPTSVLTPQGIEGLFQAIRSLAAKEKTILLITHKLKEVLAIADDITVLKNGKVTGRLIASEADESLLARLMVGREVMLRAQKTPCTPGREILCVQNLNVKDNKGVQRVFDASLHVRSGEIVGICGVAGSGQSHLAETIIGLAQPEPGSILRVEGRDVTGLSIAARRLLGVGYLPQDRNSAGVNRSGAIWETAFMGYHISSGAAKKPLLNRQDIARFTGDVLREYAVKATDIEEKVSTLSGGNVQKLVVGREFSQHYTLLVIEDPTRGIDVGAIEFIWKKIVEIARAGCAILLISHELSEVMQLSDRIMVMYEGHLTEPENSTEMSEKALGLYMLGGGIHG